MQQIIDQCTKLHEATGGKIQQDKMMFYFWKWCYCNVEKIIKQVEAELIVHGEKTRSIPIKTSTMTLGAHLAPALEWKGKFEVIREKLHTSITKLMNLDVNPHQAAICFNVYMITSVCFRK